MLLKAAFWDMDGTLIDSEPLHEEALIVALGTVGIAPPPDLHERVLGIAAYPVYKMLRDQYGLELPFDEWIVRKYAHYLKEAPRLQARPGAVEIYRELKARGITQAIVSNSDRLIVDANMRALDLHEPGMVTITRNDVRDGKPFAEPYLRAAWLCGMEPATCAVMEDSWPGSVAGLSAGMRTVFWPEAPQDGPPGALVADTADEVRGFLGLS